ncbi:hypothetical protein [Lactobacillus delbrueckii]|uniref:hypothetical protein n=1 Tax=Lactobacillus delbrueckii TaxID=1584 RepID=UPI003A89D053
MIDDHLPVAVSCRQKKKKQEEFVNMQVLDLQQLGNAGGAGLEDSKSFSLICIGSRVGDGNHSSHKKHHKGKKH